MSAFSAFLFGGEVRAVKGQHFGKDRSEHTGVLSMMHPAFPAVEVFALHRLLLRAVSLGHILQVLSFYLVVGL